MSKQSLSTPILIIAYRREDTTQKVLAAVRDACPERLYVACNAPRPDRPEEAEQCADVRRLFDTVDWPCSVHRLFRDEHLCARDSISGAISWFFENEPHGIILEDDCVPSASFFRFASELLDRYADDQRVGMISGDNFQYGRHRGEASYYFSRYCHIWGWATWRDRWASYDATMSLWPSYRARVLDSLEGPLERAYWRRILDRTHAGLIDTWDYQWLFSNWLNHRVNVIPQVNLVSNIGFGAQAHHTRNLTSAANMVAGELAFPLAHPQALLPDQEADRYTFKGSYLPSPQAVVRKLMRPGRR
ncbi:MAG: glycosyltransferase family 2 protein [Gallionellaceae bacterium]|nr:glycosyltransferase family 2 protein [Gallionellaceae bacterium]